jgi:hypothetical protein
MNQSFSRPAVLARPNLISHTQHRDDELALGFSSSSRILMPSARTSELRLSGPKRPDAGFVAYAAFRRYSIRPGRSSHSSGGSSEMRISVGHFMNLRKQNEK